MIFWAFYKAFLGNRAHCESRDRPFHERTFTAIKIAMYVLSKFHLFQFYLLEIFQRQTNKEDLGV